MQNIACQRQSNATHVFKRDDIRNLIKSTGKIFTFIRVECLRKKDNYLKNHTRGGNNYLRNKTQQCPFFA